MHDSIFNNACSKVEVVECLTNISWKMSTDVLESGGFTGHDLYVMLFFSPPEIMKLESTKKTKEEIENFVLPTISKINGKTSY